MKKKNEKIESGICDMYRKYMHLNTNADCLLFSRSINSHLCSQYLYFCLSVHKKFVTAYKQYREKKGKKVNKSQCMQCTLYIVDMWSSFHWDIYNIYVYTNMKIGKSKVN